MLAVLKRIWAISRKELTILFVRPVERRLLTIPPIVLMFLFTAAATMEVKNVDILAVNFDSGVWSQKLLSKFVAPTFKQVIFVPSIQEARKKLDQQEGLLVLLFAQDFSRKIEASQPASFQVWLDGRRSNAAQIAQGYVQQITATLAQEVPAKSPPAAQVQALYWFNPNLDFKWFSLPNIMGLVCMVMGFVISALSVARERELGTFDQLLVSPANPWEIAVAKLIPGAIIGLGHGTVFVLGAIFYFNVPMPGSLILLYLAILSFSISINGIGLLISSFSNTQQQAFLGSFTVAIPFILLSGYAAPVNNMPLFFQYLGEIDPLRHFLIIIQGIFLKGISLDMALICLGKITLIAICTVTISIIMFKKKA